MVVTEPGLFSVAAADRALRAIEEIRRGLSPRLQPLGIVVNRVRPQSIEHQFRIKELRDMFGAPRALPAAAGAHPRCSRRRVPPAAAHLAGRFRAGARGRLRPAARPDHPHRTHRRPRERSAELTLSDTHSETAILFETAVFCMTREVRRCAWCDAPTVSSTGSGAVASKATSVDSTSRSTLPTAMPNTSLTTADEVDDLVVRGAQVDRGPIAHERGACEVTDAARRSSSTAVRICCSEMAGVEKALHELEDEDVPEAVEPLRTGPARPRTVGSTSSVRAQ